MSVSIKSPAEIEILKMGGGILAGILRTVAKEVKPGVSTAELDALAERLIRKSGGLPAFKGYNPYRTRRAFPATLCVSINDEVVHGIPKKNRKLASGDTVSLDIGMFWPGQESGIRNQESGKVRPMVTDMAVTVGVGKVPKGTASLISDTREALSRGIQAVRPGAKIGDIGSAIQGFLETRGYGVVRDLAGHGVGYQLHEEPFVPNYGRRGEGLTLKEGMVIAIEPMATKGAWEVELAGDEWTFKTMDGSLAAHFEHTVAVTKEGAFVVTE